MITNDTSLHIANNNSRSMLAAENIDEKRRAQKSGSFTAPEPEVEKQEVAPEEVLDKIQSLTENGSYSVRFEMNDNSNDMIIKVVDQNSGETIRQHPAEEVLNMKKNLTDLRGNIINTVR